MPMLEKLYKKTGRISPIILPVLLLGSVALSVRFQAAVTRPEAGPGLETVRLVDPAACAVEPVSAPVRCSRVFEPDCALKRKVAGFAFLTTDLAPGVSGYGGPIRILVWTDASGVIRKLKTLEHRETPEYAYLIETEDWTRRFAGLGPESRIRPGGDVDGVTGATVTSAAYCEAVSRSIRALCAARVLGGSPAGPDAGPAAVPAGWAWAWAGIMALAAVACARGLGGRVRAGLLAVNFLLLGVVAGRLFSVTQVFQLVSGEAPSPREAWPWWIFAAGCLLPALAMGRLYCGYACPFGALQEALALLVPWKVRVPEGAHRWLLRVKTAGLWGLLLAASFAAGLRLDGAEPFAVVFGRGGGDGLAWFLVSLLAAGALLVERFYCRYLCLAGASLGLAGRVCAFPVSGGCAQGCGVCRGVCPMQCIDAAGKVNMAECIQCGRCRRACPEGRLKLSRRRFS